MPPTNKIVCHFIGDDRGRFDSKCDGYEKAWSELLPMLWQYTVTNCKGDLDAQGLDDNDLGKLKMLSDPHCKEHVHVS